MVKEMKPLLTGLTTMIGFPVNYTKENPNEQNISNAIPSTAKAFSGEACQEVSSHDILLLNRAGKLQVSNLLLVDHASLLKP